MLIAITDGRTIKNEDPDQQDIMLNLGTILTFATGMDHPPPMGFPNEPEIMFDGDRLKTLPYASTCGPTLYLPLSLSDPDYFKERMDMAVCCAHGFGNP